MTVRERTNLRELPLEHVDGRPVDLVVADVSFISLTLLVGPLTSVLRTDGTLLLMIKPQFEVGRDRLGRGGVVREPRAAAGGDPTGDRRGRRARLVRARRVVPSRLPGPAGNREFFALLRSTPPGPIRPMSRRRVGSGWSEPALCCAG